MIETEIERERLLKRREKQEENMLKKSVSFKEGLVEEEVIELDIVSKHLFSYNKDLGQANKKPNSDLNNFIRFSMQMKQLKHEK